MRATLRPYQAQVIDKIRDTYRQGYRAPLLVLPTGSGKTVCFCEIAEKVASRGRRVNILVHRQELLTQTSEHLTRLGVSHGIISPGHSMTGDAVQVSSVQTLVRRLDRATQPDLVIVDECHHATAGTWSQVLCRWSAARVLGVTATPCRLDGRGLGKAAGGFFDTMIEGPDIRTLIDAGYLAPPVVYAPPTDVDLKGVHMRGGDYAQNELSDRMDKRTITGSAIEHYNRICPGVPAIAFCASVKHAEHVAAEFEAAGIASVSLTGNMGDAVRKYRIGALATGQVRVLTSCEIISEGTDIPVVTAAILLRPTCSFGLYLQQVGRCLRPHPQKTNAIILDHVGNCLKHGLPDDVRSWSLTGEIRKKKKGAVVALPRIRQCEKCYAVFSIGLTHCPQCGWAVSFSSREVKQVEGTLTMVNRAQFEIARGRARQEQGKARTLDDLLAVAKQRGYKPYWAYQIWNARQAKEARRAYA
jgi:DNA repair protein RadD